MNTPRRFPIFVQDKDAFDTLSKKVGSLATAAASLPEHFAPLNRHSAEFLAKCCGSTSRQRLFAEVDSTPPVVPPGLTRMAVVRHFEAAVKYGVDKLATEGTFTPAQARAIIEAAPGIARAVAKDLQYLAVDHLTFERTLLDPRLLAARAPQFEYAVTSDSLGLFVFEDARQQLREAAGQESEAALQEVSADRLAQILRTSVRPLLDAVKQRKLPLTHTPVVLTDEDGGVVGVSFQHPVHLGIVPVCCEDETRFWAVATALYTSQQAQTKHGDSNALHLVDPTNVRPYFPSRFPSMFNPKQDDSGPRVFYAQVSVEKAISYLTDLKTAVNGQRVQCEESDRLVLKGASLSSTDLVSVATDTRPSIRRTYWGLVSFQSQPGQSKIMSITGTTKGLVHDGGWTAQWYLRQIYWLDEATCPELCMPSDHFLAPRDNADVTKIIPDGIEEFTRDALNHANLLAKEHKSDSVIHATLLKLQEQKKLLQTVKSTLEAEAKARVAARLARLAYAGPDVLPPV